MRNWLVQKWMTLTFLELFRSCQSLRRIRYWISPKPLEVKGHYLGLDPKDHHRWLSSVAVGRWTRDQEVVGSTPTAALFGQQPWASCWHLMCLCSPSSITWYLARAFMLKVPHCWQWHRVQWTRGYCRAVLRWSSNCVEPRYKSSALPFINRKWPIWNRMVMWLMTSHDPERSKSWPNMLKGQYLENSWPCYLATIAKITR